MALAGYSSKELTTRDDFYGFLPIHRAIENRDLAMLRRVLQTPGSNPDAETSSGYTALHLAAQYGFIEAFPLLLEFGASMTVAVGGGFGETPLHLAVLHLQDGHKNSEVINTLIKLNHPLHIKDKKGKTPLKVLEDDVQLIAIDFKKMDVSKIFTKEQYKILTEFYSLNHQSQKELNISKIFDPQTDGSLFHYIVHSLQNAKSPEDKQLLLDFAKEVIRYLKACNVDVKSLLDHNDKSERSCLRYAAIMGQEFLVQLFLENGADPDNTLEEPQFTILHNLCCEEHDYDYEVIASLLIKFGATVNQADSSGSTALHMASEFKKPNLISLLLANKTTNPNPINNDGKTPFKIATELNNPAVYNVFIMAQINPNIVDAEGDYPIHDLAHNRRISSILHLNEKCKANLKFENKKGETVDSILGSLSHLIADVLEPKEQPDLKLSLDSLKISQSEPQIIAPIPHRPGNASRENSGAAPDPLLISFSPSRSSSFASASGSILASSSSPACPTSAFQHRSSFTLQARSGGSAFAAATTPLSPKKT